MKKFRRILIILFVINAICLCVYGMNQATHPRPYTTSAPRPTRKLTPQEIMDQSYASSPSQTGPRLPGSQSLPFASTPAPTPHTHMFRTEITDRSTAFSSIAYCAGCETLRVTFRDSGKTYTYWDFTQKQWDEFRTADSLGQYYNTHIKRK